MHDADIVITATSAKDPVFDAAALSAGTHINVMGSNSPIRREVSAETLLRADRIIADSLETCRIEAGDLLLGLDEQGWDKVEELSTAPPRSNDEEITLFKSVGMGLEDVAAAAYIYEQALLFGNFPSIQFGDGGVISGSPQIAFPHR